jgi:hypothetical protein
VNALEVGTKLQTRVGSATGLVVAERLPTLLSALAQQTWLFAANKLLDVVVVLNNCDDHSAEIVNVASTRHDGLRLHVVDVRFPPPWAHVGSARRSPWSGP